MLRCKSFYVIDTLSVYTQGIFLGSDLYGISTQIKNICNTMISTQYHRVLITAAVKSQHDVQETLAVAILMQTH